VGDGEKLLTHLNSALKVLLGLDIFPRVPKEKVKFCWPVLSFGGRERCVWLSTWLSIAAVLTRNAIFQRDFIAKSPDLTPMSSVFKFPVWRPLASPAVLSFFFCGFPQLFPDLSLYSSVPGSRWRPLLSSSSHFVCYDSFSCLFRRQPSVFHIFWICSTDADQHNRKWTFPYL